MSDTCLDPSKCPAVKASVQVMEKVEKKLEENNKKQEQTNLNLARVTGAIETQSKLYENYKKDTDRDLHVLFEASVENAVNLAHVEGNIGITIAKEFGNVKTEFATEVGKINTSQATKISFRDIALIAGAITAVLGIFTAVTALLGS